MGWRDKFIITGKRVQIKLSTAVILKLQSEPESSGRFNADFWAPLPEFFLQKVQWQKPRVHISNRFPSNACATNPEDTFGGESLE